jgi:drug/metabolite transporter (DMT)-like permease
MARMNANDSKLHKIRSIRGYSQTSSPTQKAIYMSLAALGLLITAALLHAGWNLLLKQTGERYIVTWWGLIVGSVCSLPLLYSAWPLPLRVWPYVLGSALFQAAYFVILAAAYGKGDFSLVYPIARGAAPALLALWSFLLLHEMPRAAGVVGLGILLLGLLVVGSSAWWTRKEHAAPGATSIVLALLVAFCISAYSVSDGAAVKFTNPAAYTVLETALTAIFITPLTLKRYRWGVLIDEWQAQWPRITLIGLLTVFTYMLVLIAYSLAPVSYAGAIREVSVVFAALIGWLWLGEKFGPFRAIGAAVIFVGILVIAVAG